MIDKAVLRTLAYFDVFSYPLTIEELYKFVSIKTSKFDIQESLASLISNNVVYKKLDFYSISESEVVFEDRNIDNQSAANSMPVAIERARHIKKYPFVKDVLISGSLSKGVMKDNSDFDYFIVAAAKRIWICKFFLKMYKFIFLKNSRDQFCMNYFISEDDLFISEQNIFTAIELTTLIPVDGTHYKDELLRINSWVKKILPQAYELQDENSNSSSRDLTRIEKLLNGRIGDLLDRGIKSFNTLRNNLKYSDLKQSEDYELMTRGTDTQIKVHNSNHQRVILNKYQSRLKEFELEGKFVSIHV